MTLSIADEYSIGTSARPSAQLLGQLDTFIDAMRAEEPYVLGFPGNLDFAFGRLAGLLDIFVNNVGDPTSAEKSGVGAKAMERAVIDFMARLANGEPSDIYGYVAAGGSEANLFGLDRGCTLLPDAKIYCSRAAHYSIRKNTRLMRRELVVVDCDEQGRMDTAALARACAADPGHGAVVVATIGTTMSGAVDEVDAIIDAAAAAGRVYVHLDAALGGLVVPFTDLGPIWGFTRPEIGSIAVSMHKGLGMPVPCAVALCRSELVHTKVEGEYVGATDATLVCSRSGLASVLLWYSLATKGRTGLEHNARTALATAAHAVDRFTAAGLNPQWNADSIVVVFDRPAEWICRKYHLATEGNRAHIVTVPHVRPEMIDELCRDITANPSARPAIVEDPDPALATTVSTWLHDYIARPHPKLGRSGAICPFVEPTIRADGLVVRVAEWDRRYGLEEMEYLMDDAVAGFHTIAWSHPAPNRQALVIALPNLPEHQWELIDRAHRQVKDRVVAQGLMIGEFHPRCPTPAARNPDFPVNRSPVPLFAVRRMASHDILFLADEPRWFAAYHNRFGAEFAQGRIRDPHLCARYAAAAARHGYPEHPGPETIHTSAAIHAYETGLVGRGDDSGDRWSHSLE